MSSKENCHEEIRKILLKDETLVNKMKFLKDKNERSCLHLASRHGFVETVNVLLFFGAIVDDKDEFGQTSLQLASSQGHYDVIKTLIHHGASINFQDKKNGNSCLHEASLRGFSRTVQFLLTQKVNLFLQNFHGFSALHLASQSGHNETCRILLRGGSKRNLKNNYGDTPLHTAVRYGHVGVVRILHSAKTRIDLQNKNGDTALHIAAAMGKHKLVKTLLECGANVNVRNHQKETATDIASRKKHLTILNILTHSIDVKVVEKFHDESVIYEMSSKEKTRHRSHKYKKISWSPYGCHFISKNTDLLPWAPLTSFPYDPLSPGEQYFVDLGGNLRKGPKSSRFHFCSCSLPLLEEKIVEKVIKRQSETLTCQNHLKIRVEDLEKNTECSLTQLENSFLHTLKLERENCCCRQNLPSSQQPFSKIAPDTSEETLKASLSSWLEKEVESLKYNESSMHEHFSQPPPYRDPPPRNSIINPGLYPGSDEGDSHNDSGICTRTIMSSSSGPSPSLSGDQNLRENKTSDLQEPGFKNSESAKGISGTEEYLHRGSLV